MPPQDNKPNKEPQLKSARECVEWYRSIGQNASTFGMSERLAQAAKVIEEKGRGVFLLDENGKEDESQPAYLDAACLLLEAARSTPNIDEAKEYRLHAQKIAAGLIEKEDSPVALKIDAEMLVLDAAFANLYDAYYDERIDERQFAQDWQRVHEHSLEEFNETIALHAEDDEFAAGKFGEWFFINVHRHVQLGQETYDASFVRSSFTREDYALKQSKSSNFDIAYDTKANDTWRIKKKFQVKVAFNDQEHKLDYDSDIELRVERFKNGKLFDPIVTTDTSAMLAESRSMRDYRISLNPDHKLALADALERVGIE